MIFDSGDSGFFGLDAARKFLLGQSRRLPSLFQNNPDLELLVSVVEPDRELAVRFLSSRDILPKITHAEPSFLRNFFDKPLPCRSRFVAFSSSS